MEDVAGAGGVDDVDAEGGPVATGVAGISEDAVVAEGGGGEAASELALHAGECIGEVGLAGDAAGDIAADDEVVDFFEELLDAGIELVEVGNDGDAGFAGPGGGGDGGFSIVAVEVDGAGVGDPFSAQIFRAKGEAVIALPEHGALAGVLDKDEGLLAGAAGRGEEMAFDAGFAELFAVECGRIVVAELADVAGTQAPGLAGDHGGSDLSPGEDGGGAELHFGAGGGVVRNGNQRVGGVESDAHNVHGREGESFNSCSQCKWKARRDPGRRDVRRSAFSSRGAIRRRRGQR